MQKERLVSSFLEMVQIDSLSLQEKKFAEHVCQQLDELGLQIKIDDAGEKCGGDTGNVYGFLKGASGKTPVCFCGHLDTVTPGEGIVPIRNNGKIFTDGSTILAGDDKSGIAAIIEGIRSIQEDSYEHGDIEVLFTIGEENALLGSKNIDIDMIQSEMIFVLDSDGPVGGVVAYGPTQTVTEYTVHGKAAHAGVEPEKGISAIQVAAAAITNMKLLRIDAETTANIGYIKAGGPNHIVCDKAVFTSEVRSLKEKKMNAQVQHMIDCVATATAAYQTSYEAKNSINYPPFHLDEGTRILQIASKAVSNLELPLEIRGTGAGSDCNIFNGMGVDTIMLACGITQPHSTEESILESELCKAAKLVEEIIKVA